MPRIENSSFLDLASYRTTDKSTVIEAYDLDPSQVHAAPSDLSLNVALVMNRANDPTALLNQDWATRQAAIADMEADGTLWSTYGADPAAYAALVEKLEADGVTLLGSDDGYVSSAASRTIWVTLDAEQFAKIFGTELLITGDADDPDMLFWNGDLSTPDDWNVELAGLLPEALQGSAVSDLSDRGVDLDQGPQSIGNSPSEVIQATPIQISELYHFPLLGTDVATGAIGLVETGIGDALPEDASSTFQELLDDYRATIGLETPGSYYVQKQGGQVYDPDNGDERSLDVGVVAGASPNSTIGLYVGSDPGSTVFASYQSAIWDLDNDPKVISSSFSDGIYSAPDSPFMAAYQELFVDAALRNQSVFSALGDGGSANLMPNGVTNVDTTITSPYGVTVGGTSLSIPQVAVTDETLDDLAAAARSQDLDVLQVLISGGLRALPENAAILSTFVETVWNQYALTGSTLYPDYPDNFAGSGGVDPTQPTPWYQTAFGLNPVTNDPLANTGRGAPDVAALAGGNLYYEVPTAGMDGIHYSGGTSAASPLWASLAAQMNAVFTDQGLPELGYMNDLLYEAAVIAPGSFNDIRFGNNTSSFIQGGDILTAPGDGQIAITPTGYGYEATPGYDLTTGLGSPNGVLLTRALTTIAHSQTDPDAPALLDKDDGTSTVGQSVLLQPILSTSANIGVTTSDGTFSWNGSTGAAHAWTSQFAQQTLQSHFDADLVRLFDEQSQSRAEQLVLTDGSELLVDIGANNAVPAQAAFSNDYGFIDFVAAGLDDALQVARAVAVAETAGGADDQEAIVRMRQNGKNDLSLMFYEVEDFIGTVDGLKPGDEGYAAATLDHAYRTEAGEAWIQGPGHGEYLDTSILDVDDGDLIAMRLSAGTNEFFAFAEANDDEKGEPIAHLWNYGLNTWGWEDMKGGGDVDYNDLVVQIDFISASGTGLVA